MSEDDGAVVIEQTLSSLGVVNETSKMIKTRKNTGVRLDRAAALNLLASNTVACSERTWMSTYSIHLIAHSRVYSLQRKL